LVLVLEPAGCIARRLGEGRLSGHYLGEQSPGYGSQREAVMGVAKGEPQTLMSLASSDHRHHVGKAGAPSHPGLRIQPFGQREQFAGQRLIASQLDRARRRVSIGEFYTGR